MAKLSLPPLHGIKDPAIVSAITAIFDWARQVEAGGGSGNTRSAQGATGTAVANVSSNKAPPNVEAMIKRLAASFDSNLLHALRSRVNTVDGLDKGLPAMSAELVGGLLQAVRTIRADNSQIIRDLDTAFEKFQEVLLKIKQHDDTFRDAGISVDPATGHVTIFAVDQVRGDLATLRNDVSADFDALNALISLKASTTYVDQAISNAVIDPSQIPILDSVYLRLDQAEVDIDGLNASVVSKASQTEVDGIDVRLTSAESDIDGLNATVALKASTTTVNAIDSRLTTAEGTLSAIDGASITQSAVDTRYLRRTEDEQAELTLQDIINGEAIRDFSASAVSLARSDLVAKVDENLAAEALARQQLAASTAANTAAIAAEQIARTNDVFALTQSLTALQAVAAENSAAISTEQIARASADEAYASQIETISTTLNGYTATIQVLSESTNGLEAQYTVKIDNNGYVTGFGLASTQVDGAPLSEFTIVADRFQIAPVQAGDTGTSPFFYLTSGATVDGEYFEPGLYLRTAYIANLTADNIKVGSITADRIDTRGLSIKDDKGNIILSAGTALTSEFISPAAGWLNSNISIGSNGTLSGAGGGSVTLSGLGAGNFAWLNQVTSANVSTYIASAAIGGAYIANAAIGNAHISSVAANKITTGTFSASSGTNPSITILGASTDVVVVGENTSSDPFTNHTAFVGKSITSGRGVGLVGYGKMAGVVGVATSTSTSYGGYFTGQKTIKCGGVSYAVWNDAGEGKHYIPDGAGPFTGFHDALLHDSELLEIGDIVVDHSVVYSHDINNVLTLVTASTFPNERGSVGVISEMRYLDDAIQLPESVWRQYAADYTLLSINALGEGRINVCGEGGDLMIGDLITTSSMRGKGMRQNDDIVRATTVAKCREIVTFANPSEVKQVACIYLCG